jgi:isochorismate hydrolase
MTLLAPSRTFLLIIDVQERFRTVQSGFERMLAAVVRLAEAARLLEIPILVTEQYPKGLGPTVQELRNVLGESPALSKTCFSACGSEELSRRLREIDRQQALVCGIEAHVCVSQTVHDPGTLSTARLRCVAWSAPAPY